MKTRTNKKNKKNKKNITHKKKAITMMRKINGHNVLFIKNKSKTITIQSYIFKGFVHETKSNLGVNHLLEHVLSNAYKNCENYNCYEYLNLIGLLSNASTDHNIIQYYVSGLTADLDQMLDYIINITVNPIFNEKLVTKEKQAVHNELLISLDNPDQKLYDKMDRNFYIIEGLKYMDDDQLLIDNLKKLDYNYLMKYYATNYNRNNTLFVISGDYNKKDTIDIFNKKFSLIPISKIPNKKINYKSIKCFSNKKGFFHVRNPALQSTKVLFHFPANFYINSNKLIRLCLASSILQVILFDHLRVEKNLIYNINFFTTVNTCGTIQQIFVNTKNKNLKDVLDECKIIFNKYKKENIEEKYIEAAKKRYLVRYHNKKYDAAKFADLYGPQFIYKHFLDTKILSPEEYINHITNVSANEIRSIINEVFDYNKCMIVYSNNKNKINSNF